MCLAKLWNVRFFMMPLFLNSRNLLLTLHLEAFWRKIYLADPLMLCVAPTWLTVISSTAVGNRSMQAQTHRVMTVYHLKLTMPVLTKAISNTNVRA